MVKNIKGVYARLNGLRRSTFGLVNIDGAIGEEFNELLDRFESVTNDAFDDFMIPPSAFSDSAVYGRFVSPQVFRSKLEQLTDYVQAMYMVEEKVVEVGALYNSIADVELRERVSDLLTASKNFDRAINQATQVLEDRIRKKSGVDAKFSGVQLVNEVLKAEVSKTILKVSDDKDEHEGFCHICRGIMQAFRNPTHHVITDKFSREDALKACAFIDSLLRIVDKAEVRKV